MDSLQPDGPEPEPAPGHRKIRTVHPARRVVATAALAAGMAAGGYGVAHAATSSSTSSNSSASSNVAPPNAPSAARGNPFDGSHAGPGETLLTGDNATKATAA